MKLSWKKGNKIVKTELRWNQKTNKTWLEILYANGMIKVEPLTSEQAAQWTAENRF